MLPANAPFHVADRPEFKTVKDLKGKTIGVRAFGGGPDLVGRLIVKHFGLDPDKDVKWAVAGSDEGRYIRMQQGLLDATMATVPTDYLGRKMGFPVIVRSEDLFTYPFSGITASIKKIKEKPDEVKRVIRAGIKANRYMRANRDGTIPVLMTTYRIDKEVATAAYDSFIKGFNTDGSMPEDGFRRLLDDTKRLMKIDREVALSEVADLSILKKCRGNWGSNEFWILRHDLGQVLDPSAKLRIGFKIGGKTTHEEDILGLGYGYSFPRFGPRGG